MKNFIIKIFFLICALIFIGESLVLFFIRFGNISSEQVNYYYSMLFQLPMSMRVLSIFAALFLWLSCIFFINVFRKNSTPKEVIIKDRGELLRIPVTTIEDLVRQIASMNTHFDNIEMFITNSSNIVKINISCTYSGFKSVKEEVSELKEILRGEINRVLDLHRVIINFYLDGIKVRHVTQDPDNKGDFLETVYDSDAPQDDEEDLEANDEEEVSEDSSEELETEEEGNNPFVEDSEKELLEESKEESEEDGDEMGEVKGIEPDEALALAQKDVFGGIDNPPEEEVKKVSVEPEPAKYPWE